MQIDQLLASHVELVDNSNAWIKLAILEHFSILGLGQSQYLISSTIVHFETYASNGVVWDTVEVLYSLR